MKRDEIYDALADSGLSVTYLQWPEKAVPALPYICYYFPTSNNFGADNSVYAPINRLIVELYTKNKDFATEAIVEEQLGKITGFWNKSETYLDSEEMYEVLYESEVTIQDGE